MDFLIGGLAGMGASFLTNPFDVVRTRMQLQGELQAKGKHAVHYKNIPHAMYTIVKNDGVMSLQRGVVPSVTFQLVGNGVRLGLYQQADRAGLLRDERNVTKFGNSLVVGAMSGALGASIGSPLLLVKTQLMAASSGKIAVGTQHGHIGTISALVNIYRKNGVKGLWRGTYGQVVRNAVGSSTQIASYAVCKDLMDASPSFQQSNKYWSAFFASNIGAVAKTITMTPFDVIVTRLYNQPLDASGKGSLYHGVLDCARKIATAEGPLAFYKGMGPTFMRQAPHSVLLLMFWDILKDLQKKFFSSQNDKHVGSQKK